MNKEQSEMARGEGDSGLKSHFVERVVKLPMVNVVWDYASNTYTHIKESNKLVNFTLRNAERTATFVAGQAKPVVLRFERQIQAVDDLACKGLGTLEEKVPFIKKPADEIIGDTRKLYVDTVNSRLDGIKKYGNDRVRSVADFGLRQANAIFGASLVQTVLTSVDGVLVVTQSYIDHVLPPSKEEKQCNGTKEETKDQPSGVVRIVRLSNTVRRRAVRALQLKLEYAQERSLDLLLTYPITVIEFSKAHLDAAVDYANKLWIAIRQQEVDETDAAERNRMEQQLLHLARLVSKQVAGACSSLSSPSDSPNDSQEPSRAPVAVTAVTDGITWALGMLKLIPQLLPMYIYGLASWLEKVRTKETKVSTNETSNGNNVNGKEEVRANGSVQNHSVHHAHTNGCIPEEKEE